MSSRKVPEHDGGAAVPSRAILSSLLNTARERLSDIEIDVDAVEATLAMVDFSTRTIGAIETHFGRFGLSQARFSVLMNLYLHEDRNWTPAQLAAANNVSRPTLTGVLNVLKADAWIMRGPDPSDGRRVSISLSASGRKRLETVLPLHFERIHGAFAGVDADDYKLFRRAMEMMATVAENLRTHTGQ